MSNLLISLKNIHKTYENKSASPLLKDFSLQVKKGEFLCIFGPNGCGKMTLLNIISGIDKHYTGEYRKMNNLKVSYIFQNYRESLFPWLTVAENIAFPLKLMGISSDERNRAVTELCITMSVNFNLSEYPYKLSGGQQQLIAIMRALIIQPDLLLMDEPFSSLDYKTRLFLLEKTQDVWRKTGVGVVFISHEIDESVLLGERIIVLNKNPTTIIREIDNPLPYPRKISEINSEIFHQTKSKVFTAFIMASEERVNTPSHSHRPSEDII